MEAFPANIIIVYANRKKKNIDIITNNSDTQSNIPFLYLGDSDAALVENLNKNEHITHVLNVTKELKCANLSRLKTCQISIQDDMSSSIEAHIPTVIEFINDCLKQKGCILVHCYSGISRSASMVSAYLMYHFKMDLDSSLLYIKSQRNVICPNPGFVSELRKLETVLNSGEYSLQSMDNKKCILC